MQVSVTTLRDDFAPDLDDVQLQQIVVWLVQPGGQAASVTVRDVAFTPAGGARYTLPAPPAGFVTTDDGRLSTRNGSWSFLRGAPALGAAGRWELALADTAAMRQRFAREEITDILLVLTYRGTRPPWPE